MKRENIETVRDADWDDRAARWGFLGWWAVGYALFRGTVHSDHGITLLETALLFVVGMLLRHCCILCHELAHWFAGWSTGITFSRIRIGEGPRWLCWRFGGTELHWHVLPAGGAVYPAALSVARSWIGQAWFLAAGLLVDAVLCAALAWRWSALPPAAGGLAELIEHYLVVAGTFMLALDVWWSSRPAVVRSDARIVPNDGQSLLQHWRERSRWNESRRFFDAVREYEAEAGSLSSEQTKAWLAQLERQFPDRRELWMPLAQASLLARDVDAARRWVEAVLAEREPAERRYCADVFATLVLRVGLTELAGDAERWLLAEQNERSLPTTVRGTLGSLRAELGRDREAAEMLRLVLAEAESPVDRTFCDAYLGWLAAKEGRFAEADERLRRAASLNVVPDVVARLSGMVDALRNDAKERANER